MAGYAGNMPRGKCRVVEMPVRIKGGEGDLHTILSS